MRISQPETDLMAPSHKEIKMLINCLYESIFRHFYILLEGIHDLLLSAVKSFLSILRASSSGHRDHGSGVRQPSGVTRAMWSLGPDLCNDGSEL